jgi:hypothetical protein
LSVFDTVYYGRGPSNEPRSLPLFAPPIRNWLDQGGGYELLPEDVMNEGELGEGEFGEGEDTGSVIDDQARESVSDHEQASVRVPMDDAAHRRATDGESSAGGERVEL